MATELQRSSLRHVRAAQLRASATRGAVGKVAFGSVFLVGALAYALSPEKHAEVSITWMAVLLVMSSLYVGLGLRRLARVRRRSAPLWMAATAAWGVLSLTLVMFLLRA